MTLNRSVPSETQSPHSTIPLPRWMIFSVSSLCPLIIKLPPVLVSPLTPHEPALSCPPDGTLLSRWHGDVLPPQGESRFLPRNWECFLFSTLLSLHSNAQHQAVFTSPSNPSCIQMSNRESSSYRLLTPVGKFTDESGRAKRTQSRERPTTAGT